jgi:integrase
LGTFQTTPDKGFKTLSAQNRNIQKKRNIAMAEVYAVKDKTTISLISHLLEIRFSKQMSLVWQLGINLALRISDLLSIRFNDVDGDRIFIRESKTGKVANIALNAKAQLLIKEIKQAHPDHQYIFQSYRSRIAKSKAPSPLSRRSVCNALEQVGQEVKLHLGTHSMRKTRGFHLYKETGDIARVMKMLRHSSEGQTLRYIGITQEQIDTDFRELVL